MLQLGFEQIVTTIPRRFIDNCRNVDFTWPSDTQFFYPCLKVVRFIPSRAGVSVGPAMIPFVSLEIRKAKR